MTAQTYPRESVEFLPVTLTLDGVAYTGGFEVCIRPYDTRPTGWVAAETVDGVKGIMVSGLTPGLYTVWARVSDNPETPVVDCGFVLIT